MHYFAEQYNYFDKYDEEDLKQSEVFMQIESRLKQAKERVNEAKYVENLIFADLVNTIRASKTVWDYRKESIKKAQQEIGNTKKKERTNLSYIEKEVKDTFFKEFDFDIIIHEIIAGGLEDYYWRLAFKIGNMEYSIEIPIRAALTQKNFEYANKGKFVFLEHTSSCSTKVLFADWSESEFTKKIADYFTKLEDK